MLDLWLYKVNHFLFPLNRGNNEDPTCNDPTYNELLYCHLLDRDGTRLTYTHFPGRTPRKSTIDIFFNRPVYVQRNREYRICAVFNRGGYYPLGTGSSCVMARYVNFRFGPNLNHSFPLNEGIREGFIRGIIFSDWETSFNKFSRSTFHLLTVCLYRMYDCTVIKRELRIPNTC